MSQDRKKLIALLSLLVLWAAIILAQRLQGRGFEPTHVSPVPRQSRVQQGQAATHPRQAKERSEISRLTMGRIKRDRPRYVPEVRNIFASIDPSSFPPPSPQKPQVAPPPPPPAPDPFLEEAKKVRYLGYSKADGQATAFLGVGSEVLVVPETEVFGGRFRVKAIKEDTVILSSLDGTKEVRLGLSPGPGVAPPTRGKQRGKRP